MTMSTPIILITGATGAFGRAFAQQAAKHQAQLVLSARDQSKLEQLADELPASPTPILWPADLESITLAQISAALDELPVSITHFDLILYAAVELGQQTPILQSSTTNWQRLLQINVEGARLLIAACKPLLQRADRAQVILLDDPVTEQSPFWAGYGASKALLRHLASQLQLEWAKTESIRCQLYSPAPMHSSLRARAFPGENPSQHAQPALQAQLLYEQLELPSSKSSE